eukprot:235420-Rhodomonas_salina.1
MSEREAGFFAVYDGHGGKEAADLASAELHKFLQAELVPPSSSPACSSCCLKCSCVECEAGLVLPRSSSSSSSS